MKRTMMLFLLSCCFLGCSTPNYKQSAVEYLKKTLPVPASVDTIRFLKPDSVFTTFHDTKEYRALLLSYNDLIIKGDSAAAAGVMADVRKKEKTFKNVLVAWDVKLIYKAKNKKGAVKTDTCRFTFDSRLAVLKDLNGVDM